MNEEHLIYEVKMRMCLPIAVIFRSTNLNKVAAGWREITGELKVSDKETHNCL